MAFSYYNYTGDGATTQFPVAFPYIRREHVLAAVAGSPATFTFVNSSTIQMDVAPANGAVVRVYRQTPLTAPLVDFTDGATLVAADLDTNAKQSIYTQQELSDSQEEGLANVIPNGDKGDITTSVGGTIWTIDAGAVVEAKIGTGAVVEAKIGTGAVSAAKIASGAFTDSVSSTSTTTIATPNSVKTVYDAALLKAGGTMTGVITYAAAQPRLVIGTVVAPTTATSVDFLSIPSWAKRITVNLAAISTNGTSAEIIRIGDSGGFSASSYVGTMSFLTGGVGGGFGVNQLSDGFNLMGQSATTATNQITGQLTLELVGANGGFNFWVASGVIARIDGASVFQKFAAGYKGLTGTLDRVQLTTITGTASFDGGLVNIIYEG